MSSAVCLGVVVVTFNAKDVILDCLESLLASRNVALRIVVVDNASTDGTVEQIKAWAQGTHVWHPEPDLGLPPEPAAKPQPLDGTPREGCQHRLHLTQAEANKGFASGVNCGLRLLQTHPEITRFWVLNPDAFVPSETAHALATHPVPESGFALIGGRVLYADGTGRIQIDGGTLNRLTGVTGNLNLGAPHATTPPPASDQMDFIMGANMVASRTFLDQAGLMPEDYFLYYEEVDWALMRGKLPLIYCAQALVYHRAGTAIGSPTLGRLASPFSLYFKYRARLRFMRRHFPAAAPVAFAYALAKVGQLCLKGHLPEAFAIWRGITGMAPPAAVRARLSPAALAHLK